MKQIIRISFFTFLIFKLYCIPGFSQQKQNQIYSLSFTTGFRDIKYDSLLTEKHLDFVNTIENDSKTAYVGIDFDIKWNKYIESEFRLLIADSYLLNNLNFTTTIYPAKSMGINLGIYSFDYYINNYDYFFRINQPAYHTYHDDNIFQKRIGDFGFIAGPAFRFRRKRINLNLDLNFGLTSCKKFSETFVQKKINSNFKQKQQYNIINSWTSLFNPELNGEYFVFNRKKLRAGIIFKYNILFQDKSIDYVLTTYRWTEENKETETIESPKHSLNKSEIEFGIVFEW